MLGHHFVDETITDPMITVDVDMWKHNPIRDRDGSEDQHRDTTVAHAVRPHYPFHQDHATTTDASPPFAAHHQPVTDQHAASR